MSSRQEPKETSFDRAEAAARTAADELAKSRERELDRERHEAASADAGHDRQESPGVIGSLMGAVQHAKETIVGKTQETVEPGETKESAKQKAWETTEAAKQKATETKDYTAQKLGEYKDSAARKAEETKDYTAQKAEESKNKLGEYKDSAAEKTKGTAEGTRQKTREAAEKAKERLGEAGETTRQQMEGINPRAQEVKNKAGRTAEETRDATAERGREAKGGMLSSIGNVTEAIKEKFAAPKDIAEQKKHEREHGGGAEVEVVGEEIDIDVRPRLSEQMHGQTFNDVGPMGEEGTRPVGRDDQQGKM